MKSLQLTLAAALFCVPCFADIQDPPMQDQNAIRKLSRGLSNVVFGLTEIPSTMDVVNQRNGSSAAFSHGLVSGLGRTLARLGAGVYDIVTFPVPSNRGSFRSLLPAATPWVQNGFEEFPPELGFESRFDYARAQGAYSRLP